MSVGVVGTGFALGGFAPALSAAIMGQGVDGWMPVATLTSVTCVIAAISAFTTRETYKTPMHELGKKPVGAGVYA